jgi:hypothetical protein
LVIVDQVDRQSVKPYKETINVMGVSGYYFSNCMDENIKIIGWCNGYVLKAIMFDFTVSGN